MRFFIWAFVHSHPDSCPSFLWGSLPLVSPHLGLGFWEADPEAGLWVRLLKLEEEL